MQKLTTAELVRHLGANYEIRTPRDDADKKNIETAQAALSNIFALKESPPFKWFSEKCIDGKFQDAKAQFIGRGVQVANLPIAQSRFHLALEFKVWMLEQEITHRRALCPDDPEATRLAKELAEITK